MIDVPIDAPPRRTDRKVCQHCEASAAGCRSNAWLRAQACCQACDQTGRNHDHPEEASTSPAREDHVDSHGRTDGRERVSSRAQTDQRLPVHPARAQRAEPGGQPCSPSTTNPKENR